MTILNGRFLEDEQVLGRLITNAFGVQEKVELPNKHWKHFDWKRDAQGVDMDEWTKKIDLGRHDYEGFEISFSSYLEMQLVLSERRAYLSGRDMPLHINPEGYVE